MSLLYPRHIKSGNPRDFRAKISLKATSGYPLDIPGITFRISGSFLSIFQGYPKDIGGLMYLIDTYCLDHEDEKSSSLKKAKSPKIKKNCYVLHI